jgi:predicted Zn-dependent peptidase
MALLDQALHGGRAGRVYRELVLEKQLAVEADGGIDDVFVYDGPTQLTTRIFHKPEISSEETLAAFDAIVREVQEAGISDSELEQLKVKFRSDYFATLESGRGGSMPKFGLMHLLAGFTLLDGDPKLVNTILDGFLAVSKEQALGAARKFLQPQNRAIVFRKPAAGSAQEAA